MTFWRATSHVFEEEKNAMWKQYRRKGLAEMRPYIPGEDLTGITISEIDLPPEDGGMLGRNPRTMRTNGMWPRSISWMISSAPISKRCPKKEPPMDKNLKRGLQNALLLSVPIWGAIVLVLLLLFGHAKPAAAQVVPLPHDQGKVDIVPSAMTVGIIKGLQQDTTFNNPKAPATPSQQFRIEISADAPHKLKWGSQYRPRYGIALPDTTPDRDAQGDIVTLALLFGYLCPTPARVKFTATLSG